jgi:hypothetical protein
MLCKARARASVRAELSMLSECLAPYGTSLAELTIVITGEAPARAPVRAPPSSFLCAADMLDLRN